MPDPIDDLRDERVHPTPAQAANSAARKCVLAEIAYRRDAMDRFIGIVTPHGKATVLTGQHRIRVREWYDANLAALKSHAPSANADLPVWNDIPDGPPVLTPPPAPGTPGTPGNPGTPGGGV